MGLSCREKHDTREKVGDIRPPGTMKSSGFFFVFFTFLNDRCPFCLLFLCNTTPSIRIAIISLVDMTVKNKYIFFYYLTNLFIKQTLKTLNILKCASSSLALVFYRTLQGLILQGILQKTRNIVWDINNAGTQTTCLVFFFLTCQLHAHLQF